MVYAVGVSLYRILVRMKGITKIGLFDSGLGGLTVLQALEKRLPGVPKIYYGDTLHLPYGDKSDAAIISYSIKIVSFLQSEGCDLVVIACNSASAAAGKVLETEFPDLTFINVIDPVVTALANGPYKTVGLLGTRATVRRGAYPRKLEAMNPSINLCALATPLLVPLIEDGFVGSGIEFQVLKHYLDDPSLEGIEAVVPGCTHYPLLEDAASSLLEGVDWIDAPAIVAEAVALECKNSTRELSKTTFYLSDKTSSFMELAAKTFGIVADWTTKVLD